MKTLCGFSAVLLILGLGLSACQTQRRSDSPEAGIDQVLSPDGVPVYYKTSGEGDFSLVFVHDWCCDMSYWDAQFPTFGVYYKAVAVDLAGHGKSGMDRKNWTVEAFAQDVIAVVEKLNLSNVIMIGHGMGGPVILEAARRMPERVIGLVGVDSFKDMYMQSHGSEELRAFVEAWKTDFVRQMQGYIRDNYFSDWTEDPIRRQIILDMAKAPAEESVAMLEGLLAYDGAESLMEVTAPIYCINSNAHVASYVLVRKHASFFDLVYQSSAGHFPMMENPKFFNRLFISTLESVVKKSYRQ